MSATQPWWWWLLTPYAGCSCRARRVSSDGSLGYSGAYDGGNGVRPALFLASGTLVSDSTDSDGAYIIQWNQPPTQPSSISYGTPAAGKSLSITASAASDPEGNAISYVWERRVDSGVWTQIGITTTPKITDTVPTAGTTYAVRVKAVDSYGAESGYVTGSAKNISYNTAPTISGSNGNIGTFTDPPSYEYTVTDAEAATQTLTVTETLTNNGAVIGLRSYAATSGKKNKVDLSGVWLGLSTGSHTLTITVDDGNGGSATRVVTFTRKVDRLAAARAVRTDALVKKVFLSLYPDPPADATVHCEVTNNPFDDSSVWEDISGKVNRFAHTFTNTTAAKGYGLAYRFYILKDAEPVEISQVTVRFA